VFEVPSVRYRTIVADPPWDHSDGTGVTYIDGRRTESDGVPYSCLSIEAICGLPVSELAERDAHLYLWTTNRFLRESFYVAEAWGFAPVKPLVWCKDPIGFMGRPFTSSVEYALFCRRGVLPALSDAGRQWWRWPRTAHSAKPEAFLDMVEAVSPPPRLELFARRQRLGWDTWGNEAFEHVELPCA
jgi:N6-adenosine-specific RNA methylase IME4